MCVKIRTNITYAFLSNILGAIILVPLAKIFLRLYSILNLSTLTTIFNYLISLFLDDLLYMSLTVVHIYSHSQILSVCLEKRR